jgi:carboxypeptidase T
MKKIKLTNLYFYLAVLITIFSISNSFAQEKYSRARISLEGRNVYELLRLGVTLDHGVHNKKFIENDFSASELRNIAAAGFNYEILIDDVSFYYEHQNDADVKSAQSAVVCNGAGSSTVPVYNVPSNFQLGSMGGYFTYQQMLNTLDSMRAKFPNLISARQVINPSVLTHEGRPIYWLRISDNPDTDEAEPEAFYNALHHSREPMGLSQLIYFMWYILENYDNDSNIQHLINNSELYFVPCINPDGYVYNQTTNPNGGGMWRKNRRNNGGSFGVDLNRNYGYNFAFDNTGSSGTASSDTYRGPSGFSEPETRNVRDFSNAHDFLICLNYHSYGNLLVYPWAYNGLETSDSIYYRATADLMTLYNNYTTGTGTTTVGYNSNGDADDWQHGEQTTKAKTLSLTPEVGENSGGFWPASSQITRLCQSTMWQNLSHAYLLLNFGLVKDNSPSLFTQMNNFEKFQLTRYGFTNGSLTVGITPLTSNIASVGSPKSFNLNQNQSAFDSISIVLNSSIQSGDQVQFLLYVDNNAGLVFQDTITKTFGASNPGFTDPGNTLANWTNSGASGNWRVTTSSFYSAPSSITDSDATNYPNNAVSNLTLNTTIDLSNATDASLSFWAKWDLENDYDYVQVLAAGNNGVYTPLCGIYTNQGTADQQLNEPLFDGTQSTWVQENMPLNDFLGQSAVRIRFELRSDQSVRGDGYYFDEMVVNVLENLPSSNVQQRKYYSLLGQNIPNPASQMVFIPFENLSSYGSDQLTLRVTDALGRIMVNMPVRSSDNGVQLEIGQWASGTYFYQLIGNKGNSETLQMLISK